MRFNPLISHILRHPVMAMEPAALEASCSLILGNMREQVVFELPDKVLSRLIPVVRTEAADGTVVMALDNGAAVDSHDCDENDAAVAASNTKYVQVINICGAMSVNGDDCTYGSADHRKMMMSAADDADCCGHILYLDSEGGEAATLEDYREAMNYCYAKGKNVAAVFKYAASAAMFTACMTNRVWAEKPSSQCGSLGMMAIFTTIADGTEMPQSKQVVHIRYAPQSTDKNLPFRKASEGDLRMIDKMLHDELAVTLADTVSDRPSVKADQLTGKMYKAKDVMGSLVDEYGDIDAAAAWLIADYEARQGSPLPIKESSVDADAPAPVDDEGSDPEAKCDPDNNKHNHSASAADTNHNTIMTKYTNIPNAIGMSDPIEVIEGEDLSLNAELAAQLESHLGSEAERYAQSQEQVNQLTTQLSAKEAEHAQAVETVKAELQAAHQTELDTIKADHEQAVLALKAEHEQAIAALKAEHEQAIKAANDEHAAQIAAKDAVIAASAADAVKAKADIEAANQRIADLTAEVNTLNSAQGAAPHAGAQPSGNGMQASSGMRIKTSCNYDPSLSSEENARRRQQ